MIRQGLYTFTNKEQAEQYAEELNGEIERNLFPYDGEWFDVYFVWFKYESEEEDEN